jgi:hypothetical protein
MKKLWKEAYTRIASMKKNELAEWTLLNSPKELTVEENNNLPLPRLEARAYQTDTLVNQYNFVVIYSLARLNLMDKIECAVISFSKVGGHDEMERLQLPWRMEGDMLNDMYELKLPAYFVKPNQTVQLSLEDESLLPFGLKDKMKKRNNNLN